MLPIAACFILCFLYETPDKTVYKLQLQVTVIHVHRLQIKNVWNHITSSHT